MDVQEPKEEFDEEPMDEEAEEQDTPSDVVSSPDPEPAAPIEEKIPADLPPVEARRPTARDMTRPLERMDSEPQEGHLDPLCQSGTCCGQR